MSDAPVRMDVVATAGHVDHGKSTLVRALSGTDPDRLDEERRRGMTIDLGYAWMEMEDRGWVAFVDVPGHVDFIRNMIAGVAVVDAGLLVVDAGEGWRAQTHEHLLVLEVAGVDHLVVAVTKAATVDAERCEAVVADTLDELAGTRFAGSTVVVCDAVERRGLGDLTAALRTALGAAAGARDRGRPRLWVDRSFSIRGAGTVVTGGLTHGQLRPDEKVVVVGRDGTHTTRVRAVEALGRARAAALPGGRTALNLTDVRPADVTRGAAVVRDGEWHLTTTVDVELRVAPGLNHAVTRRGAYTAHIGAGAHTARLRLIGADRILPGASGWARLRLPRPLPLVPGDRYVLTESGRNETIGGGEILDVDPSLPMSRARPSRSAERIIAERGWVDIDDLPRITGEERPATVGRWVVDATTLQRAVDSLRERLGAHPGGLPLDILDDRERAVSDLLVELGEARADAGTLAPPEADPVTSHPFLQQLMASPFRPPAPTDAGASPSDIATLRRRDLVVSVDGVVFATEAIRCAAATIRRLLDQHPEGVTVATLKAELDTTRKWALPLVTHLDAIGATRRVGDVRVAGPRLDAVADDAAVTR